MIGIDISDQTLKIAQLSHGKHMRLVSHCMHPIPAGIIENGVVINQTAMEKEIVSAFEKFHIPYKKRTVVVSIPETQSFLRVIEMPEMSDAEVGEAITWEIAQHIPFSVDSVYIDWQGLRDSGHKIPPGHREIQVGAAQKKVVDPLFSVLSTIGVDVAAFELESQAIVRALISPELHAKQGVLIVDFGSTATNVIVHDVGASRFTASLQRGVNAIIAPLNPEDKKLVMGQLHSMPVDLSERIAPLIMAEIDRLVLDIRGVVDFYNSIDADHRVREVILAGGGSNLPGLDAAFLHNFEDIHVERGNPWVNILTGKDNVHPPMNIQESVRYATAIGLALRNVIAL
jgi:type IV pilus assembly protein PilM